MPTYREQKRQGRLQLHNRLAEPALYLTHPAAQATSVTVRLHVGFEQVGELFNRIGFAERNEVVPRIVFLNSQVDPIRNAIIVTKDMGAYMVDNTMPPDDITTTGEVTKMTDGQITGYGWDPAAEWLGMTPPEL